MTPSRVSFLSLPGLCLIVCACCGTAHDPVANVGDIPVTLAELEQYLALNLLTDEDDPAGADDLDRVKSRLLDALVDEKRLSHEAERLGLQVSDGEIDANLPKNTEEEPTVSWLSESRRRGLVRQRLLVHKLQIHIEDRLPAPTKDEIQAYIGESGGRLAPRKRVLLRALMFESADAAAAAATQILQRRISFADAVKTYENNPGQGVVLEFSWSALPENVQDAIAGLEPAQVSRPVDFNGDTYLFQLEAWRKDPSQMDEDLIRLAREKLVREQRRRAGERLRHELRGKTPVQIHEQRLPFRYISEAGA